MSTMFWVWLGIIIATILIEFITMELVSMWFTVGAIIPFILSTTNKIGWEIQVSIFVVVTILLIVFLRKSAKKWLIKATEKTNIDEIIGKKYRLLEKTDFETVGSIKIHDVIWSVVEENQKTIESGEIVEVVKVQGNKLVVKKSEIKED